MFSESSLFRLAFQPEFGERDTERGRRFLRRWLYNARMWPEEGGGVQTRDGLDGIDVGTEV